MLAAILALDSQNGLGLNNSIPWKETPDMRLFKDLTQGNQDLGKSTLIMGRNTWNSLGNKPLPGRKNYVLTRNHKQYNENSPMDPKVGGFVKDFHVDDGKCIQWVIGGKQIYEIFEDRLDYIHLTRIHSEYKCDAFYTPKLDNYVEIRKAVYESVLGHDVAFSLYRRKDLPKAKHHIGFEQHVRAMQTKHADIVVK